jgi:hypothetical protein
VTDRPAQITLTNVTVKEGSRGRYQIYGEAINKTHSELSAILGAAFYDADGTVMGRCQRSPAAPASPAGALGTYVAERAIGVDGPIREQYLVTQLDTDDQSRHVTEVCWPVFQTTPSS